MASADASAGFEDPLVDFPDKLKSRFQSRQHLGTGSFGETWLVRDIKMGSQTYGKDLALKLLYKELPDGTFGHLTKEMVESSGDEGLQEVYDSIIAECEMAKKISRQSHKSMQIEAAAQHLMKCYEHSDNPVYVLLSYGGSKTLEQYIQEWEPSSGKVGSILKQIFQGLQVLSLCEPPLIHHDLKSENVVVDEVDRTVQVTLIDFGEMMEYTNMSRKEKAVGSSMSVAPPEWNCVYDDCGEFKFCEGSPCSEAFDVFSAGNVLVELLTGDGTAIEWAERLTKRGPGELLGGERLKVRKRAKAWGKWLLRKARTWGRRLIEDERGEVEYKWIREHMENSDDIVRLMADFPKRLTNRVPALPSLGEDESARDFINIYLPKMLASRAENRPTLETMLQHDWMKQLSEG